MNHLQYILNMGGAASCRANLSVIDAGALAPAAMSIPRAKRVAEGDALAGVRKQASKPIRTRLASPNAKWAKSDVATTPAARATPQSAFCQLERFVRAFFRFALDASPRPSSYTPPRHCEPALGAGVAISCAAVAGESADFQLNIQLTTKETIQ